jgi:hypothetical protein
VSDEADQFRQQAEECPQLAATALKAVDRVFWLGWQRIGLGLRKKSTSEGRL